MKSNVKNVKKAPWMPQDEFKEFEHEIISEIEQNSSRQKSRGLHK